ncbi:MAG: pyrroline-5-carboxylate reductase [Clostridiales bacterium]|nr:pyrroline-5-carboxylate reductase [Clostridiales bacterium]
MKIGFIGIGNMGGAILSGYAAAESSADMTLMAYDKNEEVCSAARASIERLIICESSYDLCRDADIILLGVKPQIIETVLEEISPAYDTTKLIISMAAGIKISLLERYFGDDASIIRIMPNLPAKVGEGMISVSRNSNVNDAEFKIAMDIFSSVGRAEEVDESLIDCVIGVSGSSPAYTYMYIEALTEAAVANGMDENKARVFAAQSVLGAAKLVLESSESLEQLRINVCSPNGTTIEAVNRLFENGFKEKVIEGFQAAVDRSIEMGKEKE